MHKSNMYVHVYHPKVFENGKRGELCTHLGLLISLENKTNLSSKYHGNQPAPSIGNYVNNRLLNREIGYNEVL